MFSKKTHRPSVGLQEFHLSIAKKDPIFSNTKIKVKTMENTLNHASVLDLKYKLEPILEMLIEKEKTMLRDDWVDLVNLFRERIISLPEQYLPGEIPSARIINETVDLVVDELEGKNLMLTEN